VGGALSPFRLSRWGLRHTMPIDATAGGVTRVSAETAPRDCRFVSAGGRAVRILAACMELSGAAASAGSALRRRSSLTGDGGRKGGATATGDCLRTDTAPASSRAAKRSLSGGGGGCTGG